MNLRRIFNRNIQFFKFGLQYLSVSSLSEFFLYKLNLGKKKNKIFWIGVFDFHHRNIGDVAQTVSVRRFFTQYFDDYKVIEISRNKFERDKIVILNKLANLEKGDLVLIQSSGDLGVQHLKNNNSWHIHRQEIFKLTNLNNKVINLPATILYNTLDEDLAKLIEFDSKLFSQSNRLILGRELSSVSEFKNYPDVNIKFFPDFVFFLQRLTKNTAKNNIRENVLFCLRSDSEKCLKEDELQSLIHCFEKIEQGDIQIVDIMNSKTPCFTYLQANIVDKTMDLFEKYKLVVTDRMHGMIFAIVTNTPCIALRSGIPHKINAYSEIVNNSVYFIDSLEELHVNEVLHFLDNYQNKCDLHLQFTDFRNLFVDN